MAMVVKTVVVFLTMMYLNQECFCGVRIKNESGINNLAEEFSDLILNIGKKYFNRIQLISMVIPKEKDSTFLVIDTILKKISPFWTFVTNETYCCNYFEYWDHPYNKPVVIEYYPDIYIVPVYTEFELQIKRLEQEDYFNPRAIFMLVLLIDHCRNVKDNHQQHADIFNTMWSKNRLTVNLFILSECDHRITLVAAKPFSSENSCRSVERNGLKYFHSLFNETEYSMNFVQYKPDSFNGCNFKTGIEPARPFVIGKILKSENNNRFEFVNSTGIEIEFMRLLSQRQNFSYSFNEVISPGLDAWYEVLPNGTLTGLVLDVMAYKVDMAFGGVVPSYVTYYQFQYSFFYKFSSINWYVMDPSIAPQWKLIFRVFPLEIWVLLGFVYLIICLLYWIMEKFSSNAPNSLLDCKFNTIPFTELFVVGLGASAMLRPKHFYLRLLFFFWAVYSLHWCMAYTSVLFALMTDPPLEKEIVNINDLKDSGLKTSVESTYVYFFEMIEIDEITRSVLDNQIRCPHVELCLQELIRYRNFSVMSKAELVENFLNLRLSKVHKLSDSMMSYSVSFLMTKGIPFEAVLNKLLLSTLQLGFLNKWESDVRLLGNGNDFKSEEQKLPLSIEHLQGAFGILISGLIIAILVFKGEILVYVVASKRKLKHKQKIKSKHLKVRFCRTTRNKCKV